MHIWLCCMVSSVAVALRFRNVRQNNRGMVVDCHRHRWNILHSSWILVPFRSELTDWLTLSPRRLIPNPILFVSKAFISHVLEIGRFWKMKKLISTIGDWRPKIAHFQSQNQLYPKCWIHFYFSSLIECIQSNRSHYLTHSKPISWSKFFLFFLSQFISGVSKLFSKDQICGPELLQRAAFHFLWRNPSERE